VNEPDQEREPDRLGPKIAAGVVVAGAGVAWGPGAALALGAAGPLFESLAERAWQELRPDARQRAAQVLSTAAEAAGCDADQLGDLIGASETTRLQAGLAMRAAERTAWPPQVRALGRVLAEGLIASDDAVDVTRFALNVMVNLDRLHVSLLELLVRYRPLNMPIAPGKYEYVVEPFRDPGDDGWHRHTREWPAEAIITIRPQLRPVFNALVGTLLRYGLAVDEGYCLSPTELGEPVLGFYEEAGAEAE
jgi:hypothetical protein